MDIRAQIATVFHLDKCLGCHTCSVVCKNIWTDRKGAEYMWWNNVETRPGTGYPILWEDQEKYKGGWEVKNGKLGRMLRNPTYTGISPRFWGSMDMLGGRDEWVFWGTPNCGKGQPQQIGHTGHPAVPARFRGIRVGVRG